MTFLEKKVVGEATVEKILIYVFLLLAAYLATRMLAALTRRRFKERMSVDRLEMTVKILSAVIMVTSILGGLPLLGVDLSGLLVAGGFFGVIIGFASQNVVSNLMAGIFIMMERPIRIGQAINVGGMIGTVRDIRIMSTIIQTFDGLYIRVPNITVFTSNLINYEANVARRVDFLIGIRYGDDIDRARKTLREVIDAHPLVLVKPKAQVFVDNLGENGVVLTVRTWAPAPEWWTLRMEILSLFKKALEKEDIKVPHPQRVVWLKNGATLGTPPPEGAELDEAPPSGNTLDEAPPENRQQPPGAQPT